MKWPFSRNKDTSNVPQEIQEYYQSERRERTGVAWLLALGTLLTTIALAAVLFFAGRWVYRAVVDRGDNGRNGASTQVQQNPTENEAVNSSNDGAEDRSGQETAPADQNGGQSEGTVSDSAATDSREPTVASAGNSLPNTGPGDVLAVFLIVTAAGTLAHYALTPRRT